VTTGRGFKRSSTLVVVGALLLAACSSGGDTETAAAPTGSGAASGPAPVAGDITTLCGDEPMVVAYADGFGGNSWRKVNRAEFEDEASKCANITDVLYTDAQGDQQKAISDINGLVAQGVNVIVTSADAGAALLPAIKAATAAGVSVVTNLTDVGGTPGVDYAAFIDEDRAAAAAEWASWVGENIGEGNVVFLGGIPGNPSSQAFFEGLQTALADYPDITLLNDAPIDTNWDPAETQRVMAGLFTQYPDIDALISDYGGGSVGAIRAYLNANKPLVPLATLASNNELGCLYEEHGGEGTDFQVMSLDTTTTYSRNALRAGVADFQGIENPEPTLVEVPVFFDSLGDNPPVCDESLPPDVDLSSSLSTEQLQALFAE
jgi:ribose transport system substrate-binding protein